MAISTVNIGSAPNDGTGDPLRTAFNKLNTNFLNITADGGDEINVTDPTTSTDATLNNALANIYASGGDTPDLQEVVTAGGVVISADGLKKIEIDKDNGQIIISTRPTTGDAWVERSRIQDNAFAQSNVDGTLTSQLLHDMLTFQNPNTGVNTEYRYDRIINALDDFNSVECLLPTATDTEYNPQKIALKPILNSEDFTAELGVDYETDQDLTVTDPDDQIGSYRVFVANNNATIGGVAYPKGSRIYRYYDGTAWNTIVLATTDDIPTLDATPTNGSTNGVESNGVFDALATKVNLNRFVYNTKASITGTLTETNICSLKVDGGAYTSTDGFRLDFTQYKGTTAGTITYRAYVGTTSGARTNQILAASITGTNRTGDVARRFWIDGGSLDCAVPFTANAQSGLTVFGSINTPVSLNTANDWYITITAQGQTALETVGVLGASITPLK